MVKEESTVGELINFRGLVYSPINEQGVVFLFGRLLDDLNMYIEEVRTKYPDCVARRYTGKGWTRVYVEFEYLSSNFILHGHDPKDCDIIICWEDDLSKEQKKKVDGVEIIELKSLIKDPLIKNTKIKTPQKEIEKSEYDLTHHFNRKQVSQNVKDIYDKLHKEIVSINQNIFRKFSRTAITYYSPEKMFIYLDLMKTSIRVTVYTDENKLIPFKNITNHENWGVATIRTIKEVDSLKDALTKSFNLMEESIKENKNTGWFALTSKEHIEEDEEENELGE